MTHRPMLDARTWRHSAAAIMLLAVAVPSTFAALTPAQEKQIKIGMTMDEVRTVAGKPDNIVRVRYSPGPTWKYETSLVPRIRYFEIDFDAAGKVMWIQAHEPTEN